MILDDIVAAKQKRISQSINKLQLSELIAEVEKTGSIVPGQFRTALDSEGLSVIAEVKKASPSKGLISKDFDPVSIAKRYEEYGADAISVLTEEDFFLGSNDYLTRIRESVSTPLLRKDFIIDIWQVYESRLIGANAVLLIVSILSDKQLKEYRQIANELGMCTLVETHNEQEMKRAIDSGAQIIGINNRDLKTFEVSLETTQRLIKMIPSGITVVSESGVMNANDAKYLRELGVDAVLVGESLMKADSIQNQLSAIKGSRDGK